MAKRAAAGIVIPVLAVLVSLLIAEAAVRLAGETDEDGQFYFMDRPLKPYRLQATKAEEIVEAYLQDPSSYLVYDPYLGWAIRPDAVSDDGLYRSNSAGLRADVEYSLSPPPGVVRIALFGDSFTHGSHQPLENTWGYLLERKLRKRGLDVEVMNFGVGGYGMDQAYLRWQRMGRQYSPDIVIFGLRTDDIARNLSVVRAIQNPRTDNPFSKPRFILEGDTLKLVNSPTVPPEQVPELMTDFASSPLADYEYFFDKEDYINHWWLNSRLLALTLDVIGESKLEEKKPGQSEFSDLEGEPARLALAIIRDFRADVEAHGAQFVIVHLPRKQYLNNVRKGTSSPYDDLLEYLDENYYVVRAEEGMGGPPGKYFANHYSAEGNRAVANVVAKEIYNWVALLADMPDTEGS